MKSYLSLWDSLNKLEVIVICYNQIIKLTNKQIRRRRGEPAIQWRKKCWSLFPSQLTRLIYFTKWFQLAGALHEMEFFPWLIKTIPWNAHCHNSQSDSGHFVFFVLARLNEIIYVNIICLAFWPRGPRSKLLDKINLLKGELCSRIRWNNEHNTAKQTTLQ